MQVSGELKLARLRKLQQGKEALLCRASPASTVVQVEPEGDDPQIGYKTLPQMSWCATAHLFTLQCTWASHCLHQEGLAGWRGMKCYDVMSQVK